jgi:signal transduction histidine kinase/putative methionine-R-sulfoxide reductase with GAF domain
MNLTEEHFQLLIEANRILSSTLDLKEVLSKIMELAMEIVKSEASSILLLDEKTNELVFDVALGEKGDQVKQIRLKVGEGIAGWVAKEKKPLIINDVSKDPRWAQRIDEQADFKTKSMIAVPLIYKGRTLGVMEVINRYDGGDFTGTDLMVLEAFTAQAAICIETARLFLNLRTEKEKIELMLSQMSDGAILTDEKGGVIFYNSACKDLLSDIKGNIVDVFKPFNVVPTFDVFFSGDARTMTLEFSHIERQSMFLSGKVNRIVNNEGKMVGYILIFRNVSEEKKEEMVKRSFLSLISHKLKTPLVSIVGYSEIFLQRNDKEEEVVEAFTSINRQGRRLTALVDKLLNFSMIESGSIKIDGESVKLNEVINKTLEELTGYLKENRVKVEIDPAFGKFQHIVTGDNAKLVAVLKNLVENSVKFNKNEGKSVIIKYYGNDNMAGVCVEDDGPGITPEQKKNIFQKFYQFEESFTGQVKGAGLGLALCKLIVEAHGGKIGFESAAGQGSKFYFMVPRCGVPNTA